MKSVMLSIQPKWCEKILNGSKTIEIRKTRPKIETPFKCYIYCTKGRGKYYPEDILCLNEIDMANEKVVAEFICNGIREYDGEFNDGTCLESITEVIKYYGEEEPYYYYETSNEKIDPNKCELCEKSQVTFDEIKKYVANGKHDFFTFYGWQISDLKIYDEPKELSEFKKYLQRDKEGFIKCKYDLCPFVKNDGTWEYSCKNCSELIKMQTMTRPFQSWGYVESED